MANNWCYWGYDPESGEVKIGQSIDPDKRLGELRRERPQTYILFTIPDHSVEREHHDTWAHLRVDGEWFKPDPTMWRYIERRTGRRPDKRQAKPGLAMMVLGYLMFVSMTVMMLTWAYSWVVGYYQSALVSFGLAVLGYVTLSGTGFYEEAARHVRWLGTRAGFLALPDA